MIYATMCIGSSWLSSYKESIKQNEIISIHTNEYKRSSKSLPHIDSNSSRTYLILLEMSKKEVSYC